MGIQNYRDLTNSGNSNAVKSVNDFIGAKLGSLDDAGIEKAKNDLTEMTSALQNVLNHSEGDNSETSKALIKIRDITRDIHDEGKLKSIQKQIDAVLKLAGSADAAKAQENMKKIFDPLDHALRQNQAIISGKYSERSAQFQQWWEANKEDLFKLFTDFGMEGVDSAIATWSKVFDTGKVTEGLKNFNQQLSEAKLQAQVLAATDPYQKWLIGQSKIDENGQIKPGNFGGKDPHEIFNQQQTNAAKTAMASLRAESAKTTAEIMAKDPFEVWLVSLEKFNEQTGRMELPKDFDRNILKIQFDLIQNQQMIKEFASGVKDIFGNMITDIRDHGFKGLFTSIAQGFDQLLFKMAVEYLESQLYQLLLNSMGNLFKLPGASSGANAPGKAIGGAVAGGAGYMIGENGPELFVPGMDGFIVANHHIKNMMNGFAAGAKAGLSAGNVYNTYSSGAVNSNVRNYNVGGMMTNQTPAGQSGDSHVHLHFNTHFNVASPEQAKSLEQHVYLQAQQRADRYRKRLG